MARGWLLVASNPNEAWIPSFVGRALARQGKRAGLSIYMKRSALLDGLKADLQDATLNFRSIY